MNGKNGEKPSHKTLIAENAELRARLAAAGEELRAVEIGLARELHDEIGQALTAVVYNLQIARDSGSRTMAARLDESIVAVNRAIEQVRDFSLNLRPPVLEGSGLQEVLERCGEGWTGRTGIPVHFRAPQPAMILPRGLTMACFRVLQEALTNVLRHAQATQVWLEIGRSEDCVHMTAGIETSRSQIVS